MVRASIAVGLLPLINALYIPHDFKSFDDIVLATEERREPHHPVEAAALPNVHRPTRGKKPCARAKAIAAAEAAIDELKRAEHGAVKHHALLPVEPQGSEIIEDAYIVLLKPGAEAEVHLQWLASQATLLAQAEGLQAQGEDVDASQAWRAEGIDLKRVYNLPGFQGYAGKLIPAVAEALMKHPDVAVVERDSIVHALKPKEEEAAPWGLARVSHRDPLGLSNYNKYLYDGEGGEGVTSYIVDTGIYVDHDDFEGRAKWGKTMPYGDTDEDAHGHGSHCAGTIGGKKYGVAKRASLVAVKVLGSDGSGSMSDVIGGVEYVVESHRADQKKNPKHKGSTANMSLGGGKSPSLDLAVNAAVEAGVHFAVAAGNENQDACNVSPAGAKGPVTVGASNVKDERAYFSNYGSCVDIFAPGVNILSVGTYSPSSSQYMSGTSMASPHIAGLLTYFLSLQPSTDSEFATRGALTPKELKAHLVSFGTPGLLTDLDAESPNVLAYNGGGKDISKFWVAEEPNSSDETTLRDDVLERVKEVEHKLGHSFAEFLELGAEVVDKAEQAISHLI